MGKNGKFNLQSIIRRCVFCSNRFTMKRIWNLFGALMLAEMQASAACSIWTYPAEVVLSAGTGLVSEASSLTISNAGDSELTFTVSDFMPDNIYTWQDSNDPNGPVYDWIDISTSGIEVNLDDDNSSSTIPLGFSFPFYETQYGQLQIGANGVISFSFGELAYTNQPLPSENAPSQSVMPFWDDLYPPFGSVYYYNSTSRLVVSWEDVPLFDSISDHQTFQVAIYPDGRIVFQYKDLGGIPNSATVGLQGDNMGSDYLQVVYNEDYLTNNLAIEFTPDLEWLSWQPAGGSLQPGSSTSIWFTALAFNLRAGVYTAFVTISSNDPETPELQIPVTFTVNKQIETSVMVLDVPEGGSASFQVRLPDAPTHSTTVSVVRVSGDADIAVESGGTLVFNSDNWGDWQAVTLGAAEDTDWVDGSSLFRCSSAGLYAKDVVAFETENDFNLPFEERFENNATNAGTLGVLDGQHGWISGLGAIVQNSVAYGGSQALQLQNATASHPFVGTAALTKVEVTFIARLHPGAAPVSIPPNTSSLFFINADQHLTVYSNTVPVELSVVVDEDVWTEFSITSDYSAKTWSISIDGTSVARDLPFYSQQSSFLEFYMIDKSSTGSYIDDIAITGVDLADTDGDGLPDWWETQYYGGATNANPSASVANGLNTVWEAYIAGFDPTDPLAGFEIVDFSADAGLGHYALLWNEATGRVYSIYWTSNLLDGFTVLQTNCAGGAFTDAVHGADSKGFYRLDVDIVR